MRKRQLELKAKLQQMERNWGLRKTFKQMETGKATRKKTKRKKTWANENRIALTNSPGQWKCSKGRTQMQTKTGYNTPIEK